MRVMLINPPPFQRVDQYDTPDFPRLGLACVAGALEACGIGPVAVIDAKLERLGYTEVLDRVRSFKPDIVGLTAMTNEVLQAARVAGDLKRISPSIATAIGGVHVSVLPVDTLAEFPAFDYGVVGDGEETFPDLVAALGRSGDPGALPGLVVRRDGTPRLTPARARTDDLDTFGRPAWHLFPQASRYLVSTQRGCPFTCQFCVNPNGKVVRRRSVERVVEEMRGLVERFHAQSFYLCDEVFTLDRARTHRLLDAMIAAGIPRTVCWTAATHVNCVDRELFAKMKTAGCSLCEIGIETGDLAAMAGLGKGVTIERVRAARRDAAAAGLPFGALMILGHPGETWESAQRTIDLAVELNADQTIFGIMVPYPGTAVAEMARRGESGYRLIAADWNDYNKQHGNALELTHLTRGQLELLQAMGYVKVLLGNRRFADFARFSWKFRREGMAVLSKLATGRRPRARPPGGATETVEGVAPLSRPPRRK